MTDQKLVRGLHLEAGINYQFEILQMSSCGLRRFVFLAVVHCKDFKLMAVEVDRHTNVSQ